jgi:hypothetical protein
MYNSKKQLVGVDYKKLTTPLISIVQDLRNEIQALRDEIKLLHT